MTNDDVDFLEWLHDQRRAAEADRKRRGLSGADYLRECAREATKVRNEMETRRQVTVSDRPQSGNCNDAPKT